jgi:HEAT repeat protein
MTRKGSEVRVLYGPRSDQEIWSPVTTWSTRFREAGAICEAALSGFSPLNPCGDENCGVPDAFDLLAEADALGDLVNGHPEDVARVLPRLFEMLDESRDPIVIASVIQALGLAWNEEACLSVLRFPSDPDEQVRLDVARCAAGGLETMLPQKRSRTC